MHFILSMHLDNCISIDGYSPTLYYSLRLNTLEYIQPPMQTPTTESKQSSFRSLLETGREIFKEQPITALAASIGLVGLGYYTGVLVYYLVFYLHRSWLFLQRLLAG